MAKNSICASSHNFFIEEGDESQIARRQIIAKIANYFASRFDHKIVIITKEKFSSDLVHDLFGSLAKEKRDLISFIYCNNFQVVLDNLLEMETKRIVPKVLIIESLHQWFNQTTSITQMPSIYSTIISATIDLINVNSKILKQDCFSFVFSDIEQFPVSIIRIFYGLSTKLEELAKILDSEENKIC